MLPVVGRWSKQWRPTNKYFSQALSFSTKDALADRAREAALSTLGKSSNSFTFQKKKQKLQRDATESVEKFWNYYGDEYGSRWPSLCSALMQDNDRPAALVNPLASAATTESIDWKSILTDKHKSTNDMNVERISWVAPLEAYWAKQRSDPDKFLQWQPPCPIQLADNVPQLDDDDDVQASPSVSVLDYYCLDPSSLLPVLALNLDKADEPISVLDLCAAPGGKALAIIQALFVADKLSAQPLVVVNEVSDSRRKRLRQVLDNHVLPDDSSNNIVVTGRDGVQYGNIDRPDVRLGINFQGFSHVLCDVPCSGERYLVQNGPALANFKVSKKNQKRQVALLKAAIASSLPGGTIVYSTCSIARAENDYIVEKMLSKRSDVVELEPVTFDVGEPTKFGWIVLPDHPSCRGLGPMYIAAFRRKQ